MANMTVQPQVDAMTAYDAYDAHDAHEEADIEPIINCTDALKEEIEKLYH